MSKLHTFKVVKGKGGVKTFVDKKNPNLKVSIQPDSNNKNYVVNWKELGNVSVEKAVTYSQLIRIAAEIARDLGV